MKNDLVKLCKLSGMQFKLLYRASRDGFEAARFHAKCDNQPRTLTIITTSKGNICGGYSEVVWDTTSGYKDDPNAFLFSLKSLVALPMLIPIKSGGVNAIFCSRHQGPVFGKDLLVALLPTIKKSSSLLGISYDFNKCIFGPSGKNSFLAGSKRFKPSEIEVFCLN